MFELLSFTPGGSGGRWAGGRDGGREGRDLGTPSILWLPSPGQRQRQAFTAGGSAETREADKSEMSH